MVSKHEENDKKNGSIRQREKNIKFGNKIENFETTYL